MIKSYQKQKRRTNNSRKDFRNIKKKYYHKYDDNIVRVGLIKDRHSMPVQEYIFDRVINVFDYEYMTNVVNSFLRTRMDIEITEGIALNQCDLETVPIIKGKKKLVVYVTGLTSATAEVIKWCAKHGVSLTLMHFDYSTGGYRSQVIFD